MKNGKTPQKSRFTGIAQEKIEGSFVYPHDLRLGEPVPDTTQVLRRVLAAQPDRSVVIVQVGFSTNLARLLASDGDHHSELGGRELVALKVRMLSMMAGAFTPIGGKTHLE